MSRTVIRCSNQRCGEMQSKRTKSRWIVWHTARNEILLLPYTFISNIIQQWSRGEGNNGPYSLVQYCTRMSNYHVPLSLWLWESCTNLMTLTVFSFINSVNTSIKYHTSSRPVTYAQIIGIIYTPYPVFKKGKFAGWQVEALVGLYSHIRTIFSS